MHALILSSANGDEKSRAPLCVCVCNNFPPCVGARSISQWRNLLCIAWGLQERISILSTYNGQVALLNDVARYRCSSHPGLALSVCLCL